MLRSPGVLCRHIVVLWNSLPASEVATIATIRVHCHVTICALAIIVCCCGLSVVRSRSWCIAMCNWCILGRAKRHSRAVMCSRSIVMHSGFIHVTVGIEAIVLVVVSALIGNEYLWVCVEETPSVIVGVHCECPATCMPSHRTIEVSQAHILVELPAVQHETEVSIAAIHQMPKTSPCPFRLIR